MQTATITPAGISCLRPIPNGTGVLAATSGKRLVSQATKIFREIDPDFLEWRADGPTGPRPKTAFSTDKLVENANAATMFEGSGFFTPDQCIEFASKHRKVLAPPGRATFLPLEVVPEGIELAEDDDREQYRFAGRIVIYQRQLEIYVLQLSDDVVWHVEYGHHVVRPSGHRRN